MHVDSVILYLVNTSICEESNLISIRYSINTKIRNQMCCSIWEIVSSNDTRSYLNVTIDIFQIIETNV